MTREGRETLESSGRSAMGLYEVQKDQRLDVEERGVDLFVIRGNGGQLRLPSEFNDQGLSVKDTNNTASKFQWSCLLKESGNTMADGLQEGFQGSGYANYGREYGGLAEKLLPIESERCRNLPTYAPNVGIAEYHGRTRNVTGLPVEDAEYHERTRNVTGLQVEDAQYHGRTRNVTGLPVEDARCHRRASNVTGLPVEDAQYLGRTRNKTGLPVEDYEYHRRARNLTGLPVKDGKSSPVREYPQQMDSEMLRKSYDEGNHCRDGSHSLTPRCQSSSQHARFWGIPKENLEGLNHEPLHSLESCGSIPTSRCNSYQQILHSKASANAHPFSDEGVNYPGTKYRPSVVRSVDYIHPESQRSGKVCRRVLPNDFYEKIENVQEYDDQSDTFENDALDLNLASRGFIGNARKSSLRDDRLQSSSHAMKEASALDVYDVSRTAYEMEYDGANLCYTNSYLGYGTESSQESLPLEEEYPYEIDAYGMSYEHQMWNDLRLEEEALITDEIAQQRLESGDFTLHDQPKRMLKRKCDFVGKMSRLKHRTSTFHHGQLDMSTNIGVSYTEARSPFGGLSKALQSRLSKPHEPTIVDIKKRLKHPPVVSHPHGTQLPRLWRKNASSRVKPSPKVIHTTSALKSYGKAKGTSLKKRFKPAPHTVVCSPAPKVSRSGLDVEKQQKLAPRNSWSTQEADHSQEADPDYLILKLKPGEKDLPENSEEFEQKVDYWFLRCMRHLNVNPDRVKKFKEQGKAGCLKCIICSSSKEFVEAKDVAMHAFTSPKVGYRAPHIGFHRALCVLMGWDRTVSSNGRWVCRSLPENKACALKEDVIIWPPVVFAHNCSARNYNHDEQVKVSMEQLENVLRDMGFSEGKTKVCHGNPNVMVVKFNATLSGLQEAERLHNAFAEKKLGRAELQQIDTAVGCSEGVAHEPLDKLEDTTYGYLGIIEDLDKLECDMKRHCFAKSKKEILARADAATW